MKPKQKILEFIQKIYGENEEDLPASEAGTMNKDQRELIHELFDGMSTGTAKIIIEEEMDSRMTEDYKIDPIENKGRYYLARIVQPGGNTIRLLVDKQTGNVQFAGR